MGCMVTRFDEVNGRTNVEREGDTLQGLQTFDTSTFCGRKITFERS
jgi:hypothetical protein